MRIGGSPYKIPREDNKDRDNCKERPLPMQLPPGKILSHNTVFFTHGLNGLNSNNKIDSPYL